MSYSSVTLSHTHTTYNTHAHTENRRKKNHKIENDAVEACMLLTPQPSSIPKTLKPLIHLPFLAMKDRPSLSSHGTVYIPPHHRLRSVVTSANSPAPVAAKLRENLTPTPTTQQTPLPEQVPNKRNSRYVSAYDDGVSEEGSDREFEAPSLPVSLFKLLLRIFLSFSFVIQSVNVDICNL